MEVFILMGLRWVRSVSVVDTGVTDAEFARNRVFAKSGVDSIGVTKQ